MDYRKLLKKYIEHVGEEEGTSFLNRKGKMFTDDEWEELQEVVDENS